MSLDIKASRAYRPYSNREYVARMCWGFTQPLFRFSPRLMHGWRCLLLRVFGATVGRNVRIEPSARIMLPWMLEVGHDVAIGEGVFIYNLGPISLGARATVSHLAHLCAGTHDYRDPSLPLLRVPITIGQDAWVCASAFVGPRVIVGEGAVVGAGAVVTGNVSPWMVVAGNPAREVGVRNMRSNTFGGGTA